MKNLIALVEALMTKYSRPNNAGYINGVEDGLGYMWKVFNRIEDDYLAGIDRSLIEAAFEEIKQLNKE